LAGVPNIIPVRCAGDAGCCTALPLLPVSRR
jgi:hypothetical protein